MKLKDLKAYRKKILAIAKSCHAPNIRVFVSVARGEATENKQEFLINRSPL